MEFWREAEAEDVLEEYPDAVSDPEKYKDGLILFIIESAYYEIDYLKRKLKKLYGYLILMDAHSIHQDSDYYKYYKRLVKITWDEFSNMVKRFDDPGIILEKISDDEMLHIFGEGFGEAAIFEERDIDPITIPIDRIPDGWDLKDLIDKINPPGL